MIASMTRPTTDPMAGAMPTRDNRERSPDLPRPGPLGRLGGLAYRRRGRVLIAWAVALAAAFALSAAFGGELVNVSSTPGSDSEQAQRLLGERFPAQSGDTVRVLVRADNVSRAEVRGAVKALLDELGRMPHVTSVEDPYSTRGSITPDGRILAARVYLDVINPNDMPVEDTGKLLAAADAAERDGLNVTLGGRAVQLAEANQSGSELIGLLAAAVILLIMFGSVVAAGLPLAVAIGGLAVSASLVGLVAAVVDVPDFAPLIGMALGIALGIDYALLMVTRFREWRAVGLDPEAATVATLDTAGRAVLVAGSTVVVSMLGLFVVGLAIMNGTAVVTMVATLVVMVAAVTLFPALLGYLGQSDRPAPGAAGPPSRHRDLRRRPPGAGGRLDPVDRAGAAARPARHRGERRAAAGAGSTVPRRAVRPARRGQRPREHVESPGVRHAGRGIRYRRQRAVARGRGPVPRRRRGSPAAAGRTRRDGGSRGGVAARLNARR